MLKRQIIIFIFLIQIAHRYSAQTPDSGSVYYKKAVNAFKSQNYVLADSLYSISLYYDANPNTYFNRAIVKSELRDRCGYCENLAFASGMRDKEARHLFLKHCGKTDTIYSGRISRQAYSVFGPAYQVYFRNQYCNDVLIARYRMDNSFHSFSWAKADTRLESKKAVNDSLLKAEAEVDKSSIPAEYPGGLSAMMTFIQQNMVYPAEAMEARISGKVYIRFIINTLGYIQEIEVVKGLANCESCDMEAIRIINRMSRWHPAKMKGKPVPTYFSLPFSFKIIN